MLSIISLIYDPLGMAALFLLEGRQMSTKVGWDEKIPENLKKD